MKVFGFTIKDILLLLLIQIIVIIPLGIIKCYIPNFYLDIADMITMLGSFIIGFFIFILLKANNKIIEVEKNGT